MKIANILAYNNGSKSAKALAESFGVKRLKHEGSKYRQRGEDITINWGRSTAPKGLEGLLYLNSPYAVSQAVNKLKAFKILSEERVRTVPWTADLKIARAWLEMGCTVFVRNTLTGHSGEGIEILQGREVDPEVLNEHAKAPLFTLYQKPINEYRIHVMDSQVIFVQRKARKLDVPDDQVNWKIRNHGNGFIYAHVDVKAPLAVEQEAVKAVNALNLDFGAVDILDLGPGLPAVLEVNTACGLEGETINRYCEGFEKLVNKIGVEMYGPEEYEEDEE